MLIELLVRAYLGTVLHIEEGTQELGIFTLEKSTSTEFSDQRLSGLLLRTKLLIQWIFMECPPKACPQVTTNWLCWHESLSLSWSQFPHLQMKTPGYMSCKDMSELLQDILQVDRGKGKQTFTTGPRAAVQGAQAKGRIWTRKSWRSVSA